MFDYRGDLFVGIVVLICCLLFIAAGFLIAYHTGCVKTSGTLTINLTGDDPPLQIKLNDISELMGGQKKRIVLTVIDETDYSEWTAGKQELQGP